MREIARETFDRHAAAFGNAPVLANALDVGGDYAYRVRGEAHVWRPNVVADLQHAVRATTTRRHERQGTAEVSRIRTPHRRAVRAAS